MSNITPKLLAIYYSYPSSVNGTYTVEGAAAVFSEYDLVVFGDGLESTSHPDYQNTVDIINDSSMTNTQVYGYINSVLDITTIQTNIDAWSIMGVKGIFCDQFGYDYSVSRDQQNSILAYIHQKGLKAFVNAWNPDDVFGKTVDTTNNPNGISSIINSNDWYLAESYQIINGDYQSVSDWKTKADKLASYKKSIGTKIACIATSGDQPFDQTKADYSYFSTILYGFDAWGWGEQNYSSTSAQLPLIDRKTFYGNKFDSNIINSGDSYERRTNVGIHIDTINHTVGTLISI